MLGIFFNSGTLIIWSNIQYAVYFKISVWMHYMLSFRTSVYSMNWIVDSYMSASDLHLVGVQF